MPTFDEVQMTTLLALTDPNSPYFLKEMMELRNLDIRKEYDANIIDRTVLGILNAIRVDEKLLVNEQLRRAVETHSKYLEDYAAYQQAVYKQTRDDLNLDPKQMVEYLTKQNSDLDKEIESWKAKLITLPIDQAEISKEWTAMQEKASAEFRNKLEGSSITTLDGKQIALDEKKIEQLKDNVLNSSDDPNKLIKVNPSLVEANPAAVEDKAVRLERGRILNAGFAGLVGVGNMGGIKNSGNALLRPSELRRLEELNKPLLKDMSEVIKNQSEAACALYVRALGTSEVYINIQIDQRVKQTHTNSYELEQAKKAEKGIDQESPSYLSGPKPPGAGGART